MIGILVGVAVIAILFSTSKSQGATKMSNTSPIRSSARQWLPAILPYAKRQQIDPEYVLKWIDIESGGNPCAVGNINSKGPDGHPREMGIAQFYNPDDLNYLKITGSALRAYCKPGTNQMSRALSSAEIDEQAKATIGLINKCRSSATRDLARIKASWSPIDYWALVKLQHGLPGISRSGLPNVAAYLDRPPVGWEEFKDCILNKGVKTDSGTEPYRSVFPKVFANAEKCISVLKG